MKEMDGVKWAPVVKLSDIIKENPFMDKQYLNLVYYPYIHVNCSDEAYNRDLEKMKQVNTESFKLVMINEIALKKYLRDRYGFRNIVLVEWG